MKRKRKKRVLRGWILQALCGQGVISGELGTSFEKKKPNKTQKSPAKQQFIVRHIQYFQGWDMNPKAWSLQ